MQRYLHAIKPQHYPLARWSPAFVLTSLLVAVVFILTDHRRDLIGITGGADGPALITTIARIGLLGFAAMLALLQPQRRTLERSPLIVAIGSSALYMAAGVLWSPDPAFTVRKLVVVATVGLAAFCIAQVFDLEQITDLILVVLVAYLVLGLLYEIASGSVLFLRVYRFTGTTGPNQNGLFAAIVALIAGIRLFFTGDSRVNRKLYWLLLIGSIGITAITMSRTAMLSLVAAVLITAAVQLVMETTPAKMLVGVVSTAAIATTVVWVVLNGRRSGTLSSFGDRSAIWERLWEAVQARPIYGYGHLGYWVNSPGGRVENAHSAYLDLLLDGGVIALVIALSIMALTVVTLFTAVRQRPAAETIFCLAFICFLIVHGLAESAWTRPTIFMFFLSCVVARVALIARAPDSSGK